MILWFQVGHLNKSFALWPVCRWRGFRQYLFRRAAEPFGNWETNSKHALEVVMKFCHLLWLLQPTVLTSFQNFPPEIRLCSHRNGKLSVDLNDLNHRSDSQRGALALAVEQLPVNPWGSLRWHLGSAGCAALGKKVRIHWDSQENWHRIMSRSNSSWGFCMRPARTGEAAFGERCVLREGVPPSVSIPPCPFASLLSVSSVALPAPRTGGYCILQLFSFHKAFWEMYTFCEKCKRAAQMA